MSWQRILVDIPARLFSLWWTAYGILLTVMFMALATVMIIGMVLYAFGIRWGW